MNKKLACIIMIMVLAAFGAVATLEASAGGHDGKVDICHIPPGNPDNAHIINVSVNAVPAHLAHGDPPPGEPCGAPPPPPPPPPPPV